MSTVTPTTSEKKFGFDKWTDDGLLVASDGSDAPIVVDQGYYPEPPRFVDHEDTLYSASSQPAPVEIGDPVERPRPIPATEPKRSWIFQTKRRVFITMAVAALIVIGAIVGGAAGGTRRSSKNTTPAAAMSTPAPSTSIPTSTSSTPTSTSTSRTRASASQTSLSVVAPMHTTYID